MFAGTSEAPPSSPSPPPPPPVRSPRRLGLGRPLSTVGIGPVFLSPPPPPHPPITPSAGSPDDDDDETLRSDSCRTTTVTTPEIVGTLKRDPEDFVVREVGGRAPPRSYRSGADEGAGRESRPSSPRVADLTDTTTLPTLPEAAPPPPLRGDAEAPADNDVPEREVDGDGGRDGSPTPPAKKRRRVVDGSVDDRADESEPADAAPTDGKVDDDDVADGKVRAASSPREALEILLSMTRVDNDDNGGNGNGSAPRHSSLLAYIDALHTKVLNRIPEGPTPVDGGDTQGGGAIIDFGEDDAVWVPPFDETPRVELATASDAMVGKSGNRGAFHRCVRATFPLLRTVTVTTKTMTKKVDATPDAPAEGAESGRAGWIRIEPDPSFLGLVPYLEKPREDLVGLYRFRNGGCHIGTSNGSTSDSRGGEEGRGGSGGRGQRYGRGGRGRGTGRGGGNAGGQTLLLLRPAVNRDDRRTVHRLVAEAWREFETGTQNDVPMPPTEEDGKRKGAEEEGGEAEEKTGTGTAIVVKWSRKAQRTAIAATRRKQRPSSRNEGSHSSTSSKAASPSKVKRDASPCADLLPHTLLVLRKTNVEHLTALRHLAAAVHCRPSDIGIAGIKDMRAVTEQYCTLRNVSPAKARRANAYFKDRGITMEVGNYERVAWLLNTGDLSGNKFEVTVRDLGSVAQTRRQARSQSSPSAARCEDTKEPLDDGDGDAEEEECVAMHCTSAHLDALVNRVRSSGFINFYGEQRVGSAGLTSEVGVRSFDIGRAMLRRNFSEAIDLLMKGRLYGRAGEFAESEDLRAVRRTWTDSGGDPGATLKVMPKKESAMPRERAVLRGLKRYGRDRPLDALRCLPHGARTFWIHAYQSYVWNVMASERVRRYGTEVVEGDLYLTADLTGAGGRDVKVVTAETAGVVLGQVVLPLPGHDVLYPQNAIGDEYEKALRDDGVNFQKDAPAEATARGAYRALVGRVGSLEWEAMQEEEGGEEERDNAAAATASFSDDYEWSKGKEQAVSAAKFSFELGSGSYATMFLRELMLTTAAR